MTNINRRSIIAGAAAVAGTAPFRAFADDAPIGAWTPLASMPFPVQEIYPAPFWKAPEQGAGAKPQPFNIIVNAGGLAPDREFNVTNEVTFYDPLYDKWGYAKPLPEARHHLALVNNNGYLYGVGGFARNAQGGWQMRPDCWRIGAIGQAWAPMRSLPHPQAEMVCASVGGYIHVVGGRAPVGSRNREWADHIDTDRHWLYDPASDDWHAMAPLPTPRNSSAGAVRNGVLYVIGGRTVAGGNVATVEVYDPLSDRWEQARPMPKAQGGLAAATLGSKIYVFGGEYFSGSTGGVFAEAWEYDPYKDQWRAVAAMPRPRHGLGAVGLGNAIYVLGGAAQAGGSETSAALDKFEI